MALMLTSAGITNGSIRNELRRLVARPFEAASVAVVMTAAADDTADQGWLVVDLLRLHRLGWRKFDLIDLGELSAELVLQRLQDAQVVYFASDDAYQLAHSLDSMGLAQDIKRLLGRAVVVGAGAGSLVFCSDLTQRLMTLYRNDEDLFAANGCDAVSPLDLVPWFIHPHTDFDTWDSAAAEAVGFPMFAIDDQTAITVTDSDVVIVSEGRWRFMPGTTAGVLDTTKQRSPVGIA